MIKKIFSLMSLFFTLTASSGLPQENTERFKTDYPQLITFLGKTQFRLPTQQTTDLKATYTISKSGTYALTEDIQSSSGAGQVILITANNVILDLSGKSINLVAGSGPLINGITVATGVSNVLIRNGIITLMNGNGIFIAAGCTNIRLKNLTISQCINSGIFFSGSSRSPILGCSMKKCRIQLCNGGENDTYGLKFNYCNFFTVKQCSFINQQTSQMAKNAFDVYGSNCKNDTFIECNAQGAVGSLIGSGFYFLNCLCCIFKKCTATLTSSSAISNLGKAYGFYQNSCISTIFEECVAANISSYALSVGFYSQNCSYCNFTKCSSTNNTIYGTSGTNGSYGFLCDTSLCKGNVFDTCYASGNKGNTEAISKGCGFCLDHSQGSTITNSFSRTNDGLTGGSGIGIELRAGAVRCCISYNTIVGNTSETVGKAYGIWDQATPSKNLMLSNLAFGNRDESLTPIDQNYNANYNLNNTVQNTTKQNLAAPNTATFENTGITP